MSEILLALVSFSQVKIGLGLALCVLFTVDILFHSIKQLRDHTYVL